MNIWKFDYTVLLTKSVNRSATEELQNISIQNVKYITFKTWKAISSQGLSLYLRHKLSDKYKEIAKLQLGI